MLELIRRNHRLGTTVLWLCASLWLLAMLAGVQVRMPMQSLHVAADPALGPSPGRAAHGAHGGHAAPAVRHTLQPAHRAAAAPAPAHRDDHGDHDHHGMDCLLCMALSPPSVVVVQAYRPPMPRQGPVWQVPAHGPPSPLSTAPLPARGPPPTFHAAVS